MSFDEECGTKGDGGGGGLVAGDVRALVAVTSRSCVGGGSAHSPCPAYPFEFRLYEPTFEGGKKSLLKLS